MPGQIQLEARYYPADFNVVSEIVAIPAAGTFKLPLIHADRLLIIDSITMILQASNAPTGNVTFKIKQNTGAADPTYATTSQDIATFAQLGTGSTAAAVLTPTFATTNGSVSNNIVPAGSTVWLQASAAYGAAVNVCLQMRYRSQI